ncbi:hypothetical protein BDY24DRAFT_413797 [Mrakia frigida]|uniref:uncharacterized protein n=1 Tax=Mrakia frigida TaxID=29902 RepID=UPI003FCC1FD8
MNQSQITSHFSRAGPRPSLPHKGPPSSTKPSLKRKPTPEVINLVSDSDSDDDVEEVVPKKRKLASDQDQFLSPRPILDLVLSLYPSISPSSDLFKFIDLGLSKIKDTEELLLVALNKGELRRRVDRLEDLHKWASRKAEKEAVKKDVVAGGNGGPSSKQVISGSVKEELGGEGSGKERSSPWAFSSSKIAPSPLSFVPRAGKERAVDSSDDEVELVEDPVPARTPTAASVTPLRRFQRTPSTPPPAPTPTHRQPVPTPRSIPRISPSQPLTLSPQPKPSSSSHHSQDEREPPQHDHTPPPAPPRRTGRVRKLLHQSLAYSKSGIKLPTSRRVGRPDDDGEVVVRCAWCCKKVEVCRERMCKVGEEDAPDALGCRKCKTVYLAERQAGRCHYNALKGLVEILKPLREAHERKTRK